MPRWRFRSPNVGQIAFTLMRDDDKAIWIVSFETEFIDHEGFHRRHPMTAGTAYALWRWRRLQQ